jgi:molybdopterin-biosynthesis enzyme MoeA-like protein
MRRKKAAKPVKAKAKKTTRIQSKKQVVMNMADKMEKNFKEIPRQIVAQCRKELATFKQQESKLSTEFKKASALAKAIKAKCATLAKAKTTATVKKQLAAAKKGLKHATDAISAMSAKIEQIKKQIKVTTDKQNKFLAISKELSSFDKTWAKKTIKPAKKAPKKSVKAKKAKSAAPVKHDDSAHNTHEEASSDMQPHEPIEMDS